MTDREHLEISAEIKARVEELKREGESTDAVLTRAIDALQEEEESEKGRLVVCTRCGTHAHHWTTINDVFVCGDCAEEVDVRGD